MDRRTALRTIGAATAALGMGGIGLASVKPSNGCVLPKSEWQTLGSDWIEVCGGLAYFKVERRVTPAGKHECTVYCRRHLLTINNKHRLADDQFNWELSQIIVNRKEYPERPELEETFAQTFNTWAALQRHLSKVRPAGRAKYYCYVPIEHVT